METSKNYQTAPSDAKCMDVNFEQQLLANQLVSEVHRSTGRVSFTFTDTGILAFAKAMRLAALESDTAAGKGSSHDLFPANNSSLITKKEAMIGFKVSHTTLWKWEKLGYLKPVKIGRKVYYRKDDIIDLVK